MAVLAGGVVGGCAGAEKAASAPPPPPPAIAPPIDLRLEAPDGPGPARAVHVTVSIAPSDDVPLEVTPVSSAADSPLLALTVHWEDFRGDGPVSSGRSTQVLVPFTGLGTASAEVPLEAAFDVAVGPAEGVLARRIEVEGRLIGVDLVRPDGHSGGRLLALPHTVLASVAP